MSQVFAVIAREPRARWFLAAHVQSAIGSGAADVALVVIAYDRLRSPWAIALVLLADFLPGMALGPIFGAVADRWSRKGCAILADVVRAAAFVGIGVVHSFGATVALALLGGVGTALFSPAVLAALPTLAAPERGAAVTSLYGATRDLGRTLGPLVAAAAFPLIGVAHLMVVNGATFAASALALAFLSFGPAVSAGSHGGYRKLLTEAREGLTVTWRMPGVRVVLWASTAIIVFAAMVNVGELLLARKLGAGPSGFAVLMVAFGLGVVSGSLAGARGGPLHELKSRYVAGLLLVGAAVAALAVTPTYGAALLGFFAMGVGNGVVVVQERLIFHAAIEDRLMGRAFALLETLGAWGFAAAYGAAAALIAALGIRGMFGVAGAGGVAVWVMAAVSLRSVWRPAPAPPAIAQRVPHEAGERN
jgi:MFS family permease